MKGIPPLHAITSERSAGTFCEKVRRGRRVVVVPPIDALIADENPCFECGEIAHRVFVDRETVEVMR